MGSPPADYPSVKSSEIAKPIKFPSVTISNGGNNLGIYIPLFANSTVAQLAVIIPICY
jgi:cadmium resistance protein CadD (predicted permease)